MWGFLWLIGAFLTLLVPLVFLRVSLRKEGRFHMELAMLFGTFMAVLLGMLLRLGGPHRQGLVV